MLAYELWERNGGANSKDDEYWHAAVKLLNSEGENLDAEDPTVALAIRHWFLKTRMVEPRRVAGSGR